MEYSDCNITKNFTPNEVKEIVTRLGEAHLTPTSHNYKDYGDIKISDVAKFSFENYHEQAKKLPAIALIEVVLAANRNYNKHVLPNINRLKQDYPDLKTFDDLRKIISTKSEAEFYKIWGPKDDRKFTVLKNILSIVAGFKIENPRLSDFELMKNWADKVDLKNYKHDLIAKVKHVAIATIQHLRMTFGANTIKPDLRVMEVLKNEFGLSGIKEMTSIKVVEQISTMTKIPALQLDQIFVLYGSGYYNKQTSNTLSNAISRTTFNIARKLKDLGVSTNIVSQSTGLSELEISKL